MKPSSRIHRCLCHRAPVTVEYDAAGNISQYHCLVTARALTKDQMYMSTWGDAEEVVVDPGPDVQRGAKVND